MSKTDITLKTLPDGTLVRVHADGSEEPVAISRPLDKSPAEVEAAALDDPDNPPLDQDRLQRMKRIPRVRNIRRELGLTQEQFATRFGIPVGTLRDWEQGRSEPDQAARAYLNSIASGHSSRLAAAPQPDAPSRATLDLAYYSPQQASFADYDVADEDAEELEDNEKKKKEEVLLILSESEREIFELLVKEVGDWSVYFYGSKFISYVILAELVRAGWRKHEEP